MPEFQPIPSRKEVVRAHRAAGGRVAAVFPIHYPRELFRAFGVQPLEVWGPPGIDPSLGNAHLQSYTCSIVRCGLSFLLSGGLDSVDYIVVPHGCDSLQGLGSILLDFIKPRQPVWPFYLPRGGGAGETALSFFVDELLSLRDRLAEATGRMPSNEELLEASRREETADQALADLFTQRLQLPLSNRDLYRLARSREFLPAERFLALVQGALRERVPAPRPGKRVILSGIVPEPSQMLEVLDLAGALVAADDLACLGRRCYPAGTDSHPIRRMAERILKGPPDSLRGCSLAERVHHLRTLAQASGARGVIFYQVKFCEPEQFYLPSLRQALQESGIPSVAIEVDLADRLPLQTVTRIEAFLEMIP